MEICPGAPRVQCSALRLGSLEKVTQQVRRAPSDCGLWLWVRVRCLILEDQFSRFL